MLGELYDNILDNIDTIDIDLDKRLIDDARNFSHVYNKTFTDGPIGRILGYSRSGGEMVAPEASLEALQLGSTKGVTAFRNLKNGIISLTDDGVERVAALDESAQDFLKVLYAAAPNKKTFVRQHSLILSDYPDLKAQMLDADSAQKLSEQVSKLAVSRIERVKKASQASKFIGSEVSDGVANILRDPNPTLAMRNLKRLAMKDPTGESIIGVRASFYDHLKNDVTKTLPDGAVSVDPSKLRKFINNYSGTVRELYGETGVKLLDEVQKGAEINARLAKGVAAGGGSETYERTAGGLKRLIGSAAVILGGRLHKKANISANELLFVGQVRRGAETFASRIFEAEVDTATLLFERALIDIDFARVLLKTPSTTTVSKLPESLRNALVAASVVPTVKLTEEESE